MHKFNYEVTFFFPFSFSFWKMSMLWRRKATPEQVELPERDAKILQVYTRKVQKFDQMFKVCCCWIGYDILLEFIPIVGKVISFMFALSLYNLACSADLPKAVKKKMMYHISVDFLVMTITVRICINPPPPFFC